MDDWTAVDTEAVLTGRGDWLDDAQLAALAEHPLDCIDTEYPHFVYSVADADGFQAPSEQHPVFYGCFDWHSAVHSHWCLVRQLRLFGDHPATVDIAERLASRFTPEAIAGEVAYFDDHETFERPYGWAWLLRLAAEFALWEGERADAWREVCRPLEDRIVELVEAEFLTQARPFRVGTHQNSAFALAGVLDYARVTGNDALEATAAETARAFYADDRDYPVAYEPLSWDTVSPGLTEADLMRRVFEPARFTDWLDGFLPDVTSPPADSILDPIEVEPDEGLEFHFVGLNLTRAWCLAGIADALEDHRYVEPFERSAARHADRGLTEAFTTDYAGAHWLSSFVLYLLTRHAGGIAPN